MPMPIGDSASRSPIVWGRTASVRGELGSPKLTPTNDGVNFEWKSEQSRNAPVRTASSKG